MKILLIVNDLSGRHGWSTYALNIINESVTEGIDIVVAVKDMYEVTGHKLDQHSIMLGPQSLIWNPINVVRQSWKLHKFIKQIKPDIVHVIPEPYITPFAFINVTHIPIVLTLHGTYAVLPNSVTEIVKRTFSNLLYRLSIKKISAIIAVSKQTATAFSNRYSELVKVPIKVIPNSITLPTSHTDRYKEVNSKKVLHVLTIGAVKKRKGVHAAIALLSGWSSDRGAQVVYDVVGLMDRETQYVRDVLDGAERAESTSFKTVFHGQVDAVIKENLLKQADLYIHLEDVSGSPLEVEGFGISIIEAASYGVPALVAKGSATAEAVKDGISGYVVNMHSEAEVYASLDKLLVHDQVSRSNVLKWAEKHSSGNVFTTIKDLYISVKDSKNDI